MILFHYSDHLIAEPNYTLLLENRRNHENGALGLWSVTEEGISWAKSFGTYGYKFRVENPVIFELPVGDLQKLGTSLENQRATGAVVSVQDIFIRKRQELLACGYDMVAIIEKDGKPSQYVVLNINRVLNWVVVHIQGKIKEKQIL